MQSLSNIVCMGCCYVVFLQDTVDNASVVGRGSLCVFGLASLLSLRFFVLSRYICVLSRFVAFDTMVPARLDVSLPEFSIRFLLDCLSSALTCIIDGCFEGTISLEWWEASILVFSLAPYYLLYLRRSSYLPLVAQALRMVN